VRKILKTPFLRAFGFFKIDSMKPKLHACFALEVKFGIVACSLNALSSGSII